MKMVRAGVHLILLKATRLLWLVSSDFNASLLFIKVFDIFHCHSPGSQYRNDRLCPCFYIFTVYSGRH